MRYVSAFLVLLSVACGEAPASLPGVCIGQGAPDDVLFRPCDAFDEEDGSCYYRFLEDGYVASADEVQTCRACLGAYYPADYVEAACAKYDLED